MRRKLMFLNCDSVAIQTTWIFKSSSSVTCLQLMLFVLTLNCSNNLVVNSQSLEIDYSGHTEVEGIAGRSVSLPCNITITNGNIKEVAIILWYKGETGIPVYTVDTRNKSSLSGSIHIPSSSYKSRSYFEMSKSPPTLRLDKVSEKDSGEYRCRVDYEKYPTQNFHINLTVIVPPESIFIVNTETMEKLEGLVGPFNETSDLSLSCEVYGGQPRPTLTWWKDDKPLIASYEIISNEVTRSDLSLTNLSRPLLLSKITCKAVNSPLTDPLQTSITINLNLKPSTISIEFPSSKIISTGKRSELICRVSGSRPPARLFWWLDGRRLNKSRDTISKDGNETMSVLSFTGTSTDNGKELICQAENPLMKNSSLEESVRLNIHYVPIVNIVLGAKIDRDSIREGSDVYFECIIDSNPWLTEVTWIFNGSPLMSQPSSGIIISNQSLVLQKVKRQNRGYYSCSATNSEGIGTSDTFYLKVLFSPVCKPFQEVKFGVARNEMVNISCSVDADPDDVQFNWMLNNTLETVEIRSFTSNSSLSVVSYVPKYKNSYGVLLCWGSNKVGVQTDPCSYQVIPASPPDSVTNCTIRNQTLDSLSVSCLPGDSGGLTQIFFLEVYNSDIQKLHWSTASQVPSFYINSLPSSTRFTLNIYGSNKKGRSPSVSLTTYTLNLPQKEAKKQESTESSFQPIIGILIGIIITSLLIMFGIMICIKIRSDNNSISKDDSGKSVCSTSCMVDDNVGKSSAHHHHQGKSGDFDKIENTLDPFKEYKELYDSMDSGFNINLMKPISTKISYKDPLDKMISSSGGVVSTSPTVNNNTDVTYAELSLFSSHHHHHHYHHHNQCDNINNNNNNFNNSTNNNNNNHLNNNNNTNNSGTISRRRLKFEPTEYATIEYLTSTTNQQSANNQHHLNHNNLTIDSTGKHQENINNNNHNKLDNRSASSFNNNINNNNNNNQGMIMMTTTIEPETGEMMMMTRTANNQLIADGCSETEVSIETPLIENVKPNYRSHDIIIRKVSSSDLRIATPV